MDTDTKIHRLWELVSRTEAELATAKAEIAAARNKALDESADKLRTRSITVLDMCRITSKTYELAAKAIEALKEQSQ